MRLLKKIFIVFFTTCVIVLSETTEAPEKGFTIVAQDDCGNPNQQPNLFSGKPWTFPETNRTEVQKSDQRLVTLIHGSPVVFRYVGLDPSARYILRVHYYNSVYERKVKVDIDGELVDKEQVLPLDKLLTRIIRVTPDSYKDAFILVSFNATDGPGAIVSAIELWSDKPELLRPVGSFLRFRVDKMPDSQTQMNITAMMKVHYSPWTYSNIKLTHTSVKETGWTPWVDLLSLPGKANGSLIISIPEGAKGITRFSVVQSDTISVRDFDWEEPDGNRIIVTPDFSDLRTFREQERRYYRRTLQQTAGRLFPLARPPLFFGNAWGYTTGGAAEYMVKSFRLMGFNSVVTATDAEKYEKLYGWHSQSGEYSPPNFIPYDEEETRQKFHEYYRKYFSEGKGKNSTTNMLVFQLADEPGESAINTNLAAASFRKWLQENRVKPTVFGKKNLEEVNLLMKDPKGKDESVRYYWSRRYQSHLAAKKFALAAEAIRSNAPDKNVQSYVALSGHALYFPSKMPLDMFQLAQYPGLMPGISDWMTSGSWNWDSHQAVAFSVAPFNAGARRYGADFGKPPLSFPMMHCVYPTLFRAYTQLGNQCKFISYYNYGPDYEVTEGYWSHTDLGWGVQHVNNQAALMDDILGPALMRPSKVALLYSMAQEIWWPQGTFADKRATFLALSHCYYQPELITDEQILGGALEHYDALFVLEQFVPRTVQKEIGDWVKGGGLLWACADALARDEYNEQFDILEKLAEIKRDFTKVLSEPVQFKLVDGETLLREHEIPPQGRSKENIRPCICEWKDAKIRAIYSDGHPAMGEKSIGKGKIVYLGHRAGLVYSKRAGARGPFKLWPDDGQREVLFIPLEEAKIERELFVSGPLVMASALSTSNGTVIILYNMYHEPQTNLTVSLKEPSRPHSVQWYTWENKLSDLPYEYTDGKVVLGKFALPNTGAMIVVRRKLSPPDDRIEIMRQNAERNIASVDWQAISAGAWFAGFFPEWNMAEKLIPLLRHDHWAVRRSAAESLGRLRYKQAEKELENAIQKETDSHALVDEIEAITLICGKKILKKYAEYAKHPNPFLRSEVKNIFSNLENKQ